MAERSSAAEVISSYHDLWHVEASFRMSKSDLAARPMFHRTRDAIEAHLTIVFTALAVAREVQNAPGSRSGTSCANHAPCGVFRNMAISSGSGTRRGPGPTVHQRAQSRGKSTGAGTRRGIMRL